MRHYNLKCQVCGKIHQDDSGIIINCTCPKSNYGLLKTIYKKKELELLPAPGILKYANWLPVNINSITKFNDIKIHPLIIQNDKLGKHIGLKHLTLIYNGFWPANQVNYHTCTFKELEAITVLARMNIQKELTLVVASAGNTARAFHYYCTVFNIPALIVVPQSALTELWTTLPDSNIVSVATLEKNQDYTDAIQLADRITNIPGYCIEGGARNVARRDGLGVAVLAGVYQTNQLPQHYFQAVGSGTGAIASWELSKRLINDGRFGNYLPKLHLAQNKPFTPIYQAWKNKKNTIQPLNSEKIKKQINKLYAPVLSNRNPPYSLNGGLYDALKDTNGEMYSISNNQAISAAKLFNKIHNTDLDPAASITLASLLKAQKNYKINHTDHIFLNLTGGGKANIKKTKIKFIKPNTIINAKEITHANLLSVLTKLSKDRQKAHI